MLLDSWMRAVPLSLLCVAVISCGGGGAEDPARDAAPAQVQQPAEPNIRFEPATLSATFVGEGQMIQQPRPVVTAIIPEMAVSLGHVKVVQDTQAVTATVLPISATAGGYRLEMPLMDLPPGIHTGEFTIFQCGEPSCASLVPNVFGQLPYNITVQPGLRLSVFINGQPASGDSLSVRDGDVLRVESPQPVSWGTNTSGAFASDVVRTDTTWTGTARYGSATRGDIGNFSLEASRVSTQSRVSLRVFVTE